MVIRNKKNGRRIVAEEEFDDVDVDVGVEDVEEGGVDVAPEADGLLFEAQDVAELVAEITGDAVEVESEDGETVVFTVGEDEFTVSAEGDEEILEACGTKKKSVKSSRAIRRPATRRPIKSSRPATRRPATRTSANRTPVKSSRTVRKIPTKR